MRDVAMGQYYPGDSFVHRMDPRIKIMIAMLLIVLVFFIRTYMVYAAAFILLAVIVTLTKIPFRLILKSVKPILFLIIFTLLLNLFLTKPSADGIYVFRVFDYEKRFTDVIFSWWRFVFSLTGIDFALKMALRLLLLVMGPSLLTLTTTPVTLTDGIESLLKPLNVIRVPVHEFAIIMSIALRLIPTIIEETDKIILAQKARCADFDSGNIFKKAKALLPILIPLFLSSLRRADELALAMDSRCYHGSKGRTKMKVLRVRFSDVAALILFMLFFFIVLTLCYNFFNFPFVPGLF